MSRDFFWLTKDQFARLEPLLPTDTWGKPRVDGRRVISGIVSVLESGGRWIDARTARPHEINLARIYKVFLADGVASRAGPGCLNRFFASEPLPG